MWSCFVVQELRALTSTLTNHMQEKHLQNYLLLKEKWTIVFIRDRYNRCYKQNGKSTLWWVWWRSTCFI